ncbi:MAG: HAMP domain-containing protein, partial [Nanoarchaeota archaeon]
EYKSKLQQAMEILMEAEGEEEEGELMEYFDTESAAIIADSGKLIAAKDDGESMEKLIADYRALDKKNENFLEKLDEEIEHDTKQLNAQREIVANAVRSALKFGVLMSAVLIGILLMALLLVFQYFLKPISMLEKGANKVGAGDLEFRLNIKRNDEIGSTAESFDTMAAKLQKSREVMQNYSKELEKKVKEKTKTLEKTNEDLQKFKNLAVGRELKMIELKKKLKEKD